MNFWIFKVSHLSTYPDIPGLTYVFDNTHSVRVRRGDEFLYLSKETRSYAISGAGRVKRIASRRPQPNERRNDRVKTIFTAHLDNVVNFDPPLDISRATASGRRNRIKLGIPANVNTLGWSISMPRISHELFVTLIDAALLDSSLHVTTVDQSTERVDQETSWHIDNRMAVVTVRARLDAFRKTVLERHHYKCLVCGTVLQSTIEVAHIRGYSADPANRANPSNGICLCRYCHAAFDAGDILIQPDGNLLTVDCNDGLDEVARCHFLRIASATREDRLRGVNLGFLEERVQNRLRNAIRRKYSSLFDKTTVRNDYSSSVGGKLPR